MNTNHTKPEARRARPAASRSGAALLITLLILALMTIIVVAFLGTMSSEVQASRRNFEGQKARGIATLGLHTAVSQLRTALGQWDIPYGNEQGNLAGSATGTGFLTTTTPTNYWSVSPGILTSWSYTSPTPNTNYPLFSLPAGGMTATTAMVNSTGVTATANLNAQAEDGTYPILGTSTPLQVDWVNVLANPAVTAASQANPIIGRYAFWTDDENSKININTADGVLNTNQPAAGVVGTYMGAGTPTEVSLAELQSAGGATLSTAAATSIVGNARTYGFNSPREISRYTGGDPSIYNNNTFNLTAFSRSPDLNIFGQPKMALIPTNPLGQPYMVVTSGYAPPTYSAMWNLATLQPLKELFPSQSGTTGTSVSGVLPAITTLKDLYSVIASATTGPNTPSTTTIASAKWPVVLMDPEDSAMNPGLPSNGDNNLWDNGQVIASYLAGINAVGKPITWPAFPGAAALPSGSGYIGKYTARQIDSITMQILDLASKDASPDMGDNPTPFTRSSDSAFRGWLSGRVVNGTGRNPKLDKVAMQFTVETVGQYGPPTAKVYAPDMRAALYMEFWFPSRFSGVSLFHDEQDATMFRFGDPMQAGVMNIQDYCASNNGAAAYVGPGCLPKIPTNSWLAGYTNGNVGTSVVLPTIPGTPDGLSDSYSYWQNNLLRVVDQHTNCAGVDWQGNNPSVADPDQALAKKYHPYAATNSAGVLEGMGAGGSLASVFNMNLLVGNGSSINNEWAPGEYRCVMNSASANKCPFATNATSVAIQGGIAYISYINNSRLTDPDDVPLDAMRGTAWPTNTLNCPGNSAANQIPFSRIGSAPLTQGERIYNTLSPYTNILNAVIPMATPNIPVPAYGSSANSVWVYGTVPDPLVNKFPADWHMTASSVGSPGINPAPASMQLPLSTAAANADGSTCTEYPESSSTITSFGSYTDPVNGVNYQDPDSYWMPPIDNNANPQQGYATYDAPQIPRTSRFPSIGYLQYVRTGIMPDYDDLTPYLGSPVSYLQQHGTPYRLLNFNQISDSSQTIHSVTYPDWAMLDLFYVPSSLLGYNSPYEAFAGTKTVQQIVESGGLPPGGDVWSVNSGTYVTYSNTNAVNNMARFGTYGGATSGRINPNGSVIYTTNMNIPTPGIARTVPMQALLRGLVVNQTQSANADNSLTNGSTGTFPTEFHGPNLTAGTTITPALESTIASAVVTYLTNNPSNSKPMPMRMPAEICNVPAIASYAATGLSGVGGMTINNPTRNDLVRQIVGNLTTQSNTFSIWVEAQSIQKSKGNSNWGLYEASNPGQADDQITGTVRYHFIVERDFDTGIDGVYGNGNPAGSGPDSIIGTLDDAYASGQAGTNPQSPSYFYKIIYAEEIR